MSDFEQWHRKEFGLEQENYNYRYRKNSNDDYADEMIYFTHIGWKSAIASMQGEAIGFFGGHRHYPQGTSEFFGWVYDADLRIEKGTKLFTYPPSAASKIAKQDARIKELEAQLVSTDQLSVHDIRIGMSALLQCEVSEIETMDNRRYDESYQAVQRVIEAISLSVKQEKLFGNEIYQAAANHFEQKIKELEQQLAKLEVNHSLLRKHVRMAIDIKSMSDECYDFLTAAIRQIGGAE